jgi:anti-anti-sigma factor
MKRNLTATTLSRRARNDRAAPAGGDAHAHPGGAKGRRPQSEPARRVANLTSVRPRTHALVLEGELHHHSAHILEAEIERICAEGATSITLDLRKLTYIDSIGIAVIAFRARLCHRRGYELTVIPGSRFVHRALEQAGVSELPPLEGDDAAGEVRATSLRVNGPGER